ncbi:MAG: hypothetical protein ACLTBL_08265 [Clostridium sp.]
MKWLKLLHGMVWGPWTLLIFLGTGLFLTVKCRFFQFRGFSFWWDATAGSIIRGKKTTRQTKGRQMKVPRKPSASSSLYARPWLLPLEQEILPVLLLHLLPEAPAPCSGCGFLLLSV